MNFIHIKRDTAPCINVGMKPQISLIILPDISFIPGSFFFNCWQAAD
jgi:hypothetical protein